jgi:hypothetical protein
MIERSRDELKILLEEIDWSTTLLVQKRGMARKKRK